VLADVQKSPARKGESSKFDCQSPESRASLFFPYNLSANVRRRLLVCWPAPSDTKLESRIPNRDAEVGRTPRRRREAGAFSGKVCSVG